MIWRSRAHSVNPITRLLRPRVATFPNPSASNIATVPNQTATVFLFVAG